MDISRLDLNLLISFEALMIERNVTKAAGRLGLSQPALSAQLNRLRDMFDDQLLVPAHRGMLPTAKALDLLGPLRSALEQVRIVVSNHNTFSPKTATLTVSIACTDYIEAVVVMPLILTLRIEAPGIRVAVHRLNPLRIDQQLADGEVDLAVASPNLGSPLIYSQPMYNEDYVLIARKGHPHVAKGLTAQKFSRLEQVVVSPSGGAFTTPIDAALGTVSYKRTVVASAASFLIVPEIVAASDLVALVPRRLLTGRQLQVKVIDLPWLEERFDISLIWHERNNGHPGHRWIRQFASDLVLV